MFGFSSLSCRGTVPILDAKNRRAKKKRRLSKNRNHAKHLNKVSSNSDMDSYEKSDEEVFHRVSGRKREILRLGVWSSCMAVYKDGTSAQAGRREGGMAGGKEGAREALSFHTDSICRQNCRS